VALRVGILAIQGDVGAHARALAAAGATALPVHYPADLSQINALILPGGESTTIAKGLARLNLYGPLREHLDAGLPVLGTCAGAILLARRVENHPVTPLGVLDMTAVRNGYGTQVDSFSTTIGGEQGSGFEDLECVFIRAPRLKEPGPGVQVLVRLQGEAVLVRQRSLLAATFHPELTEDLRIHRLLIDMAKQYPVPCGSER